MEVSRAARKMQKDRRTTVRVPADLAPQEGNLAQYAREALLYYAGARRALAEQAKSSPGVSSEVDTRVKEAIAALSDQIREGFEALHERLIAVESLLKAGAMRPAESGDGSGPAPPEGSPSGKEDAEAAYEKMRSDLLGPLMKQIMGLGPKNDAKKRGAL